ncbi:MAG TPA: hypothetical protein VMW74_07935, partial [Nitrosopumilaceae archaeon]|nr:hypothetical protein [Nitrosopumilaceae archaeon]
MMLIFKRVDAFYTFGVKIKLNMNFAFVLFVLFTTLIIGSTIDAFADHSGTQGTLGKGDFEACLNDVGTFPCDTTGEWGRQNLTNEVNYTLNDSVPIRVDITDLDPNAGYHELIVEWDLAKTQGQVVKHTFDYITSFDRNDNPHPCLVLDPSPRCDTWEFDAEPIPAPSSYTDVNTVGDSMQPIDSFNSITDPNQKLFYMFADGGIVNILHADYVSEGDPNVDSTTRFSVIFSTTSSHVVAAFGAHLASSHDWINTADDVNGEPYQVRCVGINGGGCNGHVNISTEGIEPLPETSVRLIKALQIGAADVNSFGLTIGGTPVVSGETLAVSTDLAIEIDEIGADGYEFVSVSGDGCPETLPGNVGPLGAGDTITCTITNTLSDCQPGEIIIDGICQDDGCQPGEIIIDGICQDDECPAGQVLDGLICVDDECPAGQVLDGLICVDDECP